MNADIIFVVLLNCVRLSKSLLFDNFLDLTELYL